MVNNFNTSFPQFLSEQIIADLNNQLDEIIIEGLKRKGFQFENKLELEAFVASNCRCEDDTDLQQRTYFVYNQPFFVHFYESEMCLHPVVDVRTVKMSATFGSYAYL